MTRPYMQHAFQVHHARVPLTANSQDWLTSQIDHYDHVATVAAPLDRIFALTQHSDHDSWTTNEEVIWHDTTMSIRSTSIGDVIYSRSFNRAWLILPSGPHEISNTFTEL